jgi:hypothetical protein
MAHFSEQAWADFAREINDSKASAEMRLHLADRCSECTAAFATWKRVQAIAAHENSYRPPEDLVRLIKQEFATRQAPEPPVWSSAKLVFDTFSQPVLAGTRARAVTARQLVYEAEGLTVDLRLDTNPRSNRVCLVGQVLDKRIPNALGSMSVLLWTGKGHPVLQTKANELGEFQLEFEAEDNLRISIELVGRIPIRIPLANLK